MTADYTKVAFYDIRNVLWSELQAANLLDPNDYMADGFTKALVPIIPAQQVPEFNNLLPGKPYIIYDIMQNPTSVAWWMNEEIVTLNIISTNALQIQTIINFIHDVFRRYDKSAKEVNLQLASTSPFIFRFFKLEAADPVQPYVNEGGIMNASISIMYAYTRDLDPDTGRYA